ncbi:DUF1513 domain-containing protein [Vibrio sp. WXL103]|uniref:DUF1513 domain-containing protein n=1 Tax=unclassified Vibrio TaxID=2614977 RepID=UPI003EC5DCCF
MLKLLLSGLALSVWPAGAQPRINLAGNTPSLLVGATLSHDGVYALTALNASGKIKYQHPLPARGHGLAYNKQQEQIAVFARRPGGFFDVLDKGTGQLIKRVYAQAPKFFYGHGCYSSDGALLFVTESRDSSCRGVIGVYSALQGYARLADFEVGGVGPHQIECLSSDVLVCAVGGIKTHQRKKLNLDRMQPSLRYFSFDGLLLQHHQLNDPQLSIRHLTVTQDDTVYFAQQHQSPLGVIEPLVYQHRLGSAPKPLIASESQWLMFEGYIGSVVATPQSIFASSPKRGVVGVFSRDSGELSHLLYENDVCGIASHGEQLSFSSGLGKVNIAASTKIAQSSQHHFDLAWDNHLLWV